MSREPFCICRDCWDRETGGEIPVVDSMAEEERCVICGGKTSDGIYILLCSACLGEKFIVVDTGDPQDYKEVPCPECNNVY